jgi:hypothetical protein
MQFGKANERLILALTRTDSQFRKSYMYKVDIFDGFYRVPLPTSGVPKLGVCLLPFAGKPPLIAFPLVLPMGWMESPPFFCCFTETVCNITKTELQRNIRYPFHHFELLAGAADKLLDPDRGLDNIAVQPTPGSHQKRLSKQPLAFVDIFVDGLFAIMQEHKMNSLDNQRQTLMRTFNLVFCPTDKVDNST